MDNPARGVVSDSGYPTHGLSGDVLCGWRGNRVFFLATSLADARASLDNDEFTVREALVPSLDIFLVEMKRGLSVPSALAVLKNHKDLMWAQADHLLELRRTILNNPAFSQQWNLDQATDVDIDAPEAWDLTRGGNTPSGRPIVVATNSSFGVDSANFNSGDFPIWNNLCTALGQAGILNAWLRPTGTGTWTVPVTYLRPARVRTLFP